ncbi:hypothetical protein D3C73_942920 [compost metagenome]
MRWIRESRVCCGDFFDRYFELGLPTEEVSNSLLHFLFQRLTDAQQFCDALLDCDDARQKAILDRLESRIEEFPLDQSEAVIETLLKAGETVRGGESSMTFLSAQVQTFRLLLFFLRRHSEPTVRSEHLLHAFKQIKGFAVLEHLLMSESSARGKSDITDLDDAGFEALKQAFAKALLTHADQAPNDFITHWNFVSYVYRLNQFADGAGKKWVNHHVTTLERFLLLARSVVEKSMSSSGGVSSITYFVRSSMLDDLLGIEACKVWLAQVNRTTLSGPEKQAIELIDDTMGSYERDEKSNHY